MSKSLSVRIMEFVKDNPTASNREIAVAVGKSQRQVRGAIDTQYGLGYIKRLDNAAKPNSYSRRLAVTAIGEKVIAGARNYNLAVPARNSKPPEKKGEPIKRPCLMCKRPFQSKDRRKEWICKPCKGLAEYQAA